jgi:predicted component of type VI protein secretion system
MRTAGINIEAGGKTALLSGTELVVGRSTFCTMVLDDASVSRVHASLRRVGDLIELVDLGSRNGTFVNGERVGRQPVVVKPQDEIRLGRLRLMLTQSDMRVFAAAETGDNPALGPDTEEITAVHTVPPPGVEPKA